MTKQWLTDANYALCDANTSSPGCYDTSGDTAATYCADLLLGGHDDWRPPSAEELEGIVDYGKHVPAINTVYFNHTSSDSYWSSTTFEALKNRAWNVYFNNGFVYHGPKDYSHYVRCARDGE